MITSRRKLTLCQQLPSRAINFIVNIFCLNYCANALFALSGAHFSNRMSHLSSSIPSTLEQQGFGFACRPTEMQSIFFSAEDFNQTTTTLLWIKSIIITPRQLDGLRGGKDSGNREKMSCTQIERKENKTKVKLMRDLGHSLSFICVWGVCWKFCSLYHGWSYYRLFSWKLLYWTLSMQRKSQALLINRAFEIRLPLYFPL